MENKRVLFTFLTITSFLIVCQSHHQSVILVIHQVPWQWNTSVKRIHQAPYEWNSLFCTTARAISISYFGDQKFWTVPTVDDYIMLFRNYGTLCISWLQIWQLPRHMLKMFTLMKFSNLPVLSTSSIGIWLLKI